MKPIPALVALLAPALLSAQVVNEPRIALRNWATGLDEPVAITNCGDNRMFVLERDGRIKIVSDSMTVESRAFLDISGPVQSGGGEQGLLGLAFEPNYLETGYFYVYYIVGTGNGTSRISRFQVSSDPDSADAASEQVLWEWPQPFSNHNGGDLHFGPDGYLYLSLGDGGSGNDPEQNGQDYLEPLGGMIRIDVSAHDSTYLIPETNPFASGNHGDTLPEIWATGLRNPYRWGFDRLTGDLWIADVGQNAWEELDFWPAGDNSCPNFGWRCREGLVATPGVSQSNCEDASAYVSPVAVFANVGIGGDCCSMIGGRRYRGSWYPHHYGYYMWTDYCGGDFFTFSDESLTDVDTLLSTTTSGYAGFGEDPDGQIYVVNQLNGQVKKVYDPCPMADPEITSEGDLLTATEGDSYQWFLNGASINGATSQTYIASISGNYQVQVDLGTPCNLLSDTLFFTVSGVQEKDAAHLAVFPLPAKDMVTLERGASNEVLNVNMVDALGRSQWVTTWPAGQPFMTIPVADIPAGTYTVRGMATDGRLVSRATIVIAR